MGRPVSRTQGGPRPRGTGSRGPRPRRPRCDRLVSVRADRRASQPPKPEGVRGRPREAPRLACHVLLHRPRAKRRGGGDLRPARGGPIHCGQRRRYGGGVSRGLLRRTDLELVPLQWDPRNVRESGIHEDAEDREATVGRRPAGVGLAPEGPARSDPRVSRSSLEARRRRTRVEDGPPPERSSPGFESLRTSPRGDSRRGGISRMEASSLGAYEEGR